MRRGKVIHLGVLAAALVVSACGGPPAGDVGGDTASPSTDVNTATDATPAGVSDVSLSTAPLDRQAIFGLVPDAIIETAPCPFLSEATALATAKTNHELIRREVSNETCRWSKNAGFSVLVSVEPVATATPMKDRAYNLDTPPVLKPQDGPGQNAVVLYDTAWDKELPYAMGFEQADKQVVIYVTGMETDTERLTATANEVAAKLPTAPVIESQIRELKPAMDFCSIWSVDSVQSLMGPASDSAVSAAPYGAAGCKWSSGYGASAKSLTLARYSRGDTDMDRMVELGGNDISGLGDRAVILSRAAADGYAGDTAIWVDVEEQQFNLTISGTVDGHAGVGEQLIKNLFSRM